MLAPYIADVLYCIAFVGIQSVGVDLFYHPASLPPTLRWDDIADPHVLAPHSFAHFLCLGHFEQGLNCADLIYITHDMDGFAFVGVLPVPVLKLRGVYVAPESLAPECGA